MDAQELSKLADYDFEALSKDIFQTVLARRLEIFGPGQDRGIDLQHISPASSTADDVVIQCKQYFRSGSAKLLAHYRSEEAGKVARMGRVRYILATTAELTVDFKEKMLGLLSPQLRSTSDIWGGNEIAEYLEGNPEIVKRHLQLWLTSSSVLRAALDRGTDFRNEDLSIQIDNTILRYVSTPAHNRARNLLGRHRVCLISGIPGVGKSTLAKALIAELGAEGHQIVQASSKIRDAHEAWSRNTKQVFYIDDLFGPTMVDPERMFAAEQDLPALVRRILREPDQYLVMTSRDYVLRQVLETFKGIEGLDLEERVVQLDVNDFDESTRAQILYKHISQSGLSPKQREKFADRSNYLQIIQERGYVPRLIEEAIREASSDEGRDAVAIALSHLRNPKLLWEKLFSSILDADSIGLVVSVFSLGSNQVDIDWLYDVWINYTGRENNPEARRILRASLRKLENTLLRDDTIGRRKKGYYSLHNPSVIDYLQAFVTQNEEVFERLIETSDSFEQLYNLWVLRWSRVGREARRIYAEHETLLRTILVRIIKNRNPRDKIGEVRTVDLCVDIADSVSGPELPHAVSDMMRGSFDVKHEEKRLPQLAVRLRGSQHLELRKDTRKIVRLYADFVLDEDTLDWDELKTAGAELEDISKDGDSDVDVDLDAIDRALEHVHDCQVEIATDEILLWFDEGADAEIDGDLREKVEWMVNNSEDCEGLEQAEAHLDSPSVSSTVIRRPVRCVPVDMESMFNTLRRDRDR